MLNPSFLPRRLEESRDRIELRLGRPRGAVGEASAALTELRLAKCVRRVDEVHLGRATRAENQRAEPVALPASIAGEVEHDQMPACEEIADVIRERRTESRRTATESLHVIRDFLADCLSEALARTSKGPKRGKARA